MDDYNKIIDINKYKNEEEHSKRIFKKSGFFEKYNIFFDKPTHIIDNIYLGSAVNAASLRILKELNIKVIVNISHELSNYHKDSESQEFIYHKHTVHDDNNYCISRTQFENIYQDIIKYDKDTNILVHCYMGASRSPSIVAYYLMRKKGLNLDEAIEYIRNRRPIVNLTFRLLKNLAKTQIIEKDDN